MSGGSQYKEYYPVVCVIHKPYNVVCAFSVCLGISSDSYSSNTAVAYPTAQVATSNCGTTFVWNLAIVIVILIIAVSSAPAVALGMSFIQWAPSP